MKKGIALLLILTFLFSLSGCQSAEAKKTDELIATIGDVTLDSGAAIAQAEEAYAALSDKDKEGVKKSDNLRVARKTYDNMVAAKEVDALISALGEADFSLVPALKDARNAYNALNDNAKSYVTTLDKLEYTEKAMEDILTLVGTWLYEADLSEQMKEEMAELDDSFLTNDLRFTVPITFSFDDKGGVNLSVDQELLKKSMDDFLDPFVDYLLEIVKQEYVNSGMNPDEFDSLIQQTMGMSAEDYLRSTLDQLTEELYKDFDLSYNASYYIDGNNIVLEGEDGSVDRMEFVCDGEKLTILSSELPFEDEMGVFTFPVEFIRR